MKSEHTLKSTREKIHTRVLLIETGLHNNETIVYALESNGMEVHQITLNGKKPDARIYSNADIIIFDTGNLTVEGYEYCSTIRMFSQVPLLVLSSLSQPNVIANMLDYGADDFLTKPISIEVLVAHINKLTRRARRTGQTL